MHLYFKVAVYGPLNAAPNRKRIQGNVVMGGEAEWQENAPGFLPASAVKMTSSKDRKFVLDTEEYYYQNVSSRKRKKK